MVSALSKQKSGKLTIYCVRLQLTLHWRVHASEKMHELKSPHIERNPDFWKHHGKRKLARAIGGTNVVLD